MQKNLINTVIILLAMALLLNGCAGQRRVSPPPPQPYPAKPAEKTGPTLPDEPATKPAPIVTPSPPSPPYLPKTGPGAALYHDAEKTLQQGQWEQAEMLLERALRIEPRNAHYWHTLARVKYAQGDAPQTIQFCLKSNSLAGGQPQLIEMNTRLMQQAREGR